MNDSDEYSPGGAWSCREKPNMADCDWFTGGSHLIQHPPRSAYHHLCHSKEVALHCLVILSVERRISDLECYRCTLIILIFDVTNLQYRFIDVTNLYGKVVMLQIYHYLCGWKKVI
jgi:hypothetical protein